MVYFNKYHQRTRYETLMKSSEWQPIKWSTPLREITGVLMWDLSAAFDTLDHEILLSKFEIYGFSELTIKWMRGYLTGRNLLLLLLPLTASVKDTTYQGGEIERI